MSKRELNALHQAKDAFTEKYGKHKWFRAIGIAPSDDGLVLRLNTDPDIETKDEIPTTYQGFTIEVVQIKEYKLRLGAT